MKKLRLLIALCTLLIGGGNLANAYTVDDLTSAGWTKVTDLSSLTLGDHYFVLVDGTDASLIFTRAGVGTTARPVYQPMENPAAARNEVWMIEASADKYRLQSYADNYYYTNGNAGWNNSMQSSADGNSDLTFTLSGDKYHLTTGAGAIGCWDTFNLINTTYGYAGVAGNNGSGGDKDHGFTLYSIPRANYTTAIASAEYAAAGWIRVEALSDWGNATRQYVLLDVSETGYETSMAMTATDGLPAYQYSDMANNNQKWLTETSGDGYALKSVGYGKYSNYTAPWGGNMSDDAPANVFVPYALTDGKWSIKNTSDNDRRLGRWGDTGNGRSNNQDPYAGESIASNKDAGNGRRCFFVYAIPTAVGTAEALPASGDMDADKWYYFDIDIANNYSATATTLANISCVEYSSGNNVALAATNNSLAVTRYYVKSSSANNLVVAVADYTPYYDQISGLITQGQVVGKNSATTATELANAMTEGQGYIDGASTDTDALNASIARLTAAVSAAQASAAVYADIATAISTYAAKAAALDAAGQAAYDASAVQTKYDNGTYATLAEAQTELRAALVAAVKVQTTVGSDMTAIIVNADFEGAYTSVAQPSGDRNIYQPEGWNVTWENGDGNDMTSLNSTTTSWSNFSGQAQPVDGGNNVYWIRYRWGNQSSITLSQTVNLPAGNYRLSAEGFNSNATNATAKMTVSFSATNAETTFTDAAWTVKSTEFKLAEAADVTISYNLVENAQVEIRAGIDNFTLTYLGADASAADYTALNDAIAAAEAKTLGFETGEYAPYNNVAAITTLAAAKAIDQTVANAKISVTDATAALTAATWTANAAEVSAILWKTDYTAGDKAGDNYIHPLGWTNTGYNTRALNTEVSSDACLSTIGTAIMMKYNTTYGETAGYTMPLKAGKIYKISFRYCGWGNNPTTNIVLTDPESNAISLAPGFRPATNDGNSNAEHWYDYVGYFVSTTAGNYVLAFNKVESGQQQIGLTNVQLVSASEIEFADGSVPTYAPGTYPSVKITRILTADKWATAVYPFAVSGVDKIAVLKSYDNTTGTLDFSTAAASEANVPFLMKSTTDKSAITLSNVAVAAASVTDATAAEASLKGTYAAINITDAEKNYVLSDNTIYSVGAAGATINPYRAYIQVSQDAPARLTMVIDGEQTTGIENLTQENLTSVLSKGKGVVYNLNGQRVETVRKGMFVVNGKKVIVK